MVLVWCAFRRKRETCESVILINSPHGNLVRDASEETFLLQKGTASGDKKAVLRKVRQI